MHVFHNFCLFFAIVILEVSRFLTENSNSLGDFFPAMDSKKFKDYYIENFEKIWKKCKVDFLILIFHRQTIWPYLYFSTLGYARYIKQIWNIYTFEAWCIVVVQKKEIRKNQFPLQKKSSYESLKSLANPWKSF